MSKDTAANPSDTLFDYPTSELKNLAKEYNLAYYINNIERLTKSELVDAIMDHMTWKKAQEEVDNRIQFKKSMKGISLNYDKERDKTKPRQRLNYQELKKAHPILTSKHQEIPKYKGKKDWSQTHLKEISPAVVEAVQGNVPGVAEILSQFRKMTDAQQKQVINNLGLTEAQVLPPGVPALGEMEEKDEIKVANTIKKILEVVQEQNPMEGIEIRPKSTNKLDDFKAKLGEPPIKDPYPPYKSLGDQFLNFLEKVRLQVMKRYKEDAPEEGSSGRASFLRGYESLKISPFVMKGVLWVGIQSLTQDEPQTPGQKSWAVYYYDEDRGDITYEIGVTEPNNSRGWAANLFSIKIGEEWKSNMGLGPKEREMRKIIQDVKISNADYIMFNEEAGLSDDDFPYRKVWEKYGFMLPSEKIMNINDRLKAINLKGGVVITKDPAMLSAMANTFKSTTKLPPNVKS
jgi:hypothetical protein